jgi:DNA/RNA endonuclease YhcR with UshA esterase domain
MHLRVIALFVTAFGAAQPAVAHHSFSGEFDVNKPIKLEGTVTRVEWINPHAWIHIDVKRPDGTLESWAIEGGTPNTLMRRGFTKDSLKAGTEIVVDGYLSRDGSRKANGRDVTFTDGRKLFIGSPPGQGGPPQ